MTVLIGAARVGPLAAAIFLTLVAGADRAAGDETVFPITDVSVDATAKNANAARELAIAEGHTLAFQRLIARIVRTADVDDIPKLEHAEVAPMVRSFEVANEKSSRVRYLARLTFQFDRELVRRFLRAISIPFAETRGQPVLVLPVLRSAGTYLLWDEPNRWREAWINLPEHGGLIPLLMPIGDLQDVQDISAAQAAGGHSTRIQAIAKRYNAVEVIVAVASLSHSADWRPQVQVTLNQYGGADQGQTIIESYRATTTENVDQLMQSVAHHTARGIQDAWKERHLLRFDQQNRLDAIVPISGLSQWVRISRALTKIPSIEQSQVLSLSRNQARLRLRYYGDHEQLAGALVRQDLQLLQKDEAWILRLASRDPGSPSTPGLQQTGAGTIEGAEEAGPE